MKNRKYISVLLVLLMVASILGACGGTAPESSAADTPAASAPPADGAEAATEATTAEVLQAGEEAIGQSAHIEGATDMDLWTFVDLHKDFYVTMADLWNQENPDRAINLTVTSGESSAMQTKMLVAMQSGEGGPDIADIEVGNFGNFIKGDPYLLPLNDIIEPEKDNIVYSRVEMYGNDAGDIFGIDFHVGASVTYYNMDIMNEAGIDPATLTTWDKYVEAGRTVLETTGKPMFGVETADLFVPQMMMLEKGIQFLDASGAPNINTPEHAEVIDFLRAALAEGIAIIPAGGNFHREEWYGQMSGGEVASITMPLWYMGRFTDYMPNLKGKIAIYPDPVWNEGDVRSVCQGGTGTAVTKQAEDPDLAKAFLSYAKLSETGNRYVWDMLGFDPIRTSLWTDEEVTHNPDNKFIAYFATNPFDVLNEVGPNLLSMSIKGGYAATSSILTSTTYANAFEMAVDTPAADLLAEEQATIIYEP